MNESLQELEVKVENEGATPQGKLSADEWNIVVEALKKIDNDSALWATESWVEEQQYLTEITSGMIESVLGYQPYDGDTNRLGFLTSSALNGYATQSWVNTALAGYLPLSGGTVNGPITASSFIGNLTGTADNANELNGYPIAYFMIFRNIANTYVSAKLADSGLSKLAAEGYLEFWDSSGWYNSKWGTVTAKDGFIGNLTGNADSATKLATTRTIWGQSFDGTGDVLANKGVGLMSSQKYYGLSILPDTSVYGVRTFLTYDEGSTMGAYEISASYAVRGLSIGVATGLEYNTTIIPSAASYTPVVVIKKNGNVAIGGTTANAKLHVYGNLLTEGGITMYSQRSLKNILSYDGLSLEQLSVIKPIKFTWKDGRDNRYHVGGIADDMATVVPEVVYSTNDFLTMDYGNAGFYVAASLIKPVIYCYNKVEKHEKDIDYLKRENVAIKNENKALREEINQLKQTS